MPGRSSKHFPKWWKLVIDHGWIRQMSTLNTQIQQKILNLNLSGVLGEDSQQNLNKQKFRVFFCTFQSTHSSQKHRWLANPRKWGLHGACNLKSKGWEWYTPPKTNVSTKTGLHPWKCTWNPKMKVWKMIFLFKQVIFRFHVNFPRCISIGNACSKFQPLIFRGHVSFLVSKLTHIWAKKTKMNIKHVWNHTWYPIAWPLNLF